MSETLKIAFVVSSTLELPSWEIESLKKLSRITEISIVALIIADPVAEKSKPIGINWFEKFENKWFKSIPDAFQKKSIPEELKGISKISSTDLHQITELKPDVIYSSYGAAYTPELAAFSKYGIWHIVFGSGKYSASEPTAFWEVMDDCAEAGSKLCMRLTGNDADIPVYEGTTSSVPYSVKNTLNVIGWRAASYLPFRLNELVKSGGAIFFSKYNIRSRVIANAEKVKPKSYPGNLKTGFLFFRNLFRYLWTKLSALAGEKKFTLLFSRSTFQLTNTDFSGFTSLKLTKGVFWADPFVIRKKGSTFIFFEEYLYKTGKAHISVIELYENGEHSSPVIVLEKPYHLSYPFLLESGESIFMIPETSGNKTVDLYKCSEFPFKWEFVKHLLLDIDLADVTLIHHNDKWWLFGIGQNHPHTSTNDQLFLYYSDSFSSSKWISHPQNPVATFISNCRPDGNIFKSDGKLYRPSQNNASRQYGYALKINEIMVMNELEYTEKEVWEVKPGPQNKLHAVHTINFLNDIIIIDGIR